MTTKNENLINLTKNILNERGAEVSRIVESEGNFTLYIKSDEPYPVIGAQIWPNAPKNDKRFPQIEIFVERK